MSEQSPSMPAVSPYLIVDGAAEAIDFYTKAFGATELQRVPGADGTLMHAAMSVDGSTLMLRDDCPEHRDDGRASTPRALGGSPVVLHLVVPDVDTTWQQALDAGATVVLPLEDQFWGDRYGQLMDPFGHVWSLATPKTS